MLTTEILLLAATFFVAASIYSTVGHAGASGYYQFTPSTWKGIGGSTPHAYQASKAEQDRLAARLWAGGSGARNWDCAALVGLL